MKNLKKSFKISRKDTVVPSFKGYLVPLCSLLLACTFGCASPSSVGKDSGKRKSQKTSDVRKSKMRLPGVPPKKDTAQPRQVAPSRPLASGPQGQTYRLRTDDALVVHLRGIPNEQTLDLAVDEHGKVNLTYLDPVQAEGLTSSELEQAIHDAYVPDFYKQLTVNILIPSQSYYVRGEVRSPGRYPIVRGGITLLQAIATSGGFTDYANPKDVKILREGDAVEYNVKDIEEDPTKDVSVIAGDYIVVPRSRF